MAQTPNVIGSAVMQRLKETGEPATPENYERCYYDLSGLPRPQRPVEAASAPAAAISPEVLTVLRQMLREVTDKTETLAKDLGEKNKDMAGNVDGLRNSRDKTEVLRLLSTVVMQAGGIQNTVEASHKDLVRTRQTLAAMEHELAETRQLLNEDALTGALNRRGLDQTLVREIARARRDNRKLALAMLDLDFFKKINDEHGHDVGDRMLVHFTGLIKAVMRKSDALVRFGGEEFTLIMPDTDARFADIVLGRLQKLMRNSPLICEGKRINTTFSAGVVDLRADENGQTLLRRADEALYAAKNGGRNTIRVAV